MMRPIFVFFVTATDWYDEAAGLDPNVLLPTRFDMKQGTVFLARARMAGVFYLCFLAVHPAAPARETNESLSSNSNDQPAQQPANSLVEKSKRAIIETGISESYFDKHFKLVKSVDDPADRRVEWLYSVNEYKAQLVDAIGFHATGGKRTLVHGIKNQLYATHEIFKTLPLRQARRILKRCIGKFDGESVSYRTLTVPGKARLYLSGRSIPERDREVKKETEGEPEGRALYVGFVDVETGKCVKKLGRGSS